MSKNIRNGKNVWVNEDGSIKVKSETRPSDGRWYPAYPQSRVHGNSYEYYDGTSEWEKAANKAMANATRS